MWGPLLCAYPLSGSEFTRPGDLRCWPVPFVGHASTGKLVERCFGAGTIDLLRGDFRHRAERTRAGDAIAVAVGGDDPRVLAPPLLPTGIRRRCAEWACPGLVVSKSCVKDCVGAGFDQVTTLVQCLTHVCGDWAVDAWDQAGNQTRRPAGAAGTGRSRSGVGEAVMDDRGEILGVLKSAGLDEAWQELVDVVMVGLGPSQLRGQCAEGVGVDDGLGLLVGEPAGTDEARPAVVLGGLSDGLVFGGERCD